MQKSIYLIIFLFLSFSIKAQDEARELLRGQVLFENSYVPNENVINVTTEMATVTNSAGEFEIMVKEGDVLAFTAINYELKSVTITSEILQNKRLVVEVTEKITELDEVTISNAKREKFIELKNEEFKKVDYVVDASSKIENQAFSISDQGMKNGLNFVNIFKALLNSNKNQTEASTASNIKLSDVLRQVYNDDFFVIDLKIPQDKINDFLYYLDTKPNSTQVFLKENEFERIDYLVNQSREFNNTLKETN